MSQVSVLPFARRPLVDLVEPFAGTAAVSAYMMGEDGQYWTCAYMGNKWRYRRWVAEALASVGCHRGHVRCHVSDLGPWGRWWASSPEERREAAEQAYEWALAFQRRVPEWDEPTGRYTGPVTWTDEDRAWFDADVRARLAGGTLAGWLYAQSVSFGGRPPPVGTIAPCSRWHIYLHAGVRRMAGRPAAIEWAAARQCAAIDAPIPRGAIVYLDPPYQGTTGYRHDGDVAQVVERARDLGASAVIVSEGRPIDLPGRWGRYERQVGGSGSATGGKRRTEHLAVWKRP